MIHQEPNWSRHMRLYRDRVNGGSVTVPVVPYADTFTHADVWFDELRDTWRVTVFDRAGRIVGKDDEYTDKADAVHTATGFIESGRLSNCRVFTQDDSSWEYIGARQ